MLHPDGSILYTELSEPVSTDLNDEPGSRPSCACAFPPTPVCLSTHRFMSYVHAFSASSEPEMMESPRHSFPILKSTTDSPAHAERTSASRIAGLLALV